MATYETADEALDHLEEIAPAALPLPALTAYLAHPEQVLLLDDATCRVYLVADGDVHGHDGEPAENFTITELTPGRALELPGIHASVMRWVAFLAGEHGRDEDYSNVGRPVVEEAMAVLREACRLEIAERYRRHGADALPEGDVPGELAVAVDRALNAGDGPLESLRLRLARAYHLRAVLDRYAEAVEREIAEFLDLPPRTVERFAHTAHPYAGVRPPGAVVPGLDPRQHDG